MDTPATDRLTWSVMKAAQTPNSFPGIDAMREPVECAARCGVDRIEGLLPCAPCRDAARISSEPGKLSENWSSCESHGLPDDPQHLDRLRLRPLARTSTELLHLRSLGHFARDQIAPRAAEIDRVTSFRASQPAEQGARSGCSASRSRSSAAPISGLGYPAKQQSPRRRCRAPPRRSGCPTVRTPTWCVNQFRRQRHAGAGNR